jgi:hypothetical protein
VRLRLLLIALAALVSAPASAADPNLFVGASGNLLRWDPGAAVGLTQSLGVGVYRISVLWSPGETTIGTDVAIQLRQAIAATPGGRIIVSVYSAYGKDAPKIPAARDQFCGYVADLITQYPEINDIELWIEPNKTQFWAPQFGPDESATAPAQYEALLARCYDVLHAVRPTVNVLAPGTSPRGNDDPHARDNISESPGNFIRRMGAAYRASGRTRPIFDTVGHNAYGDTAAERPWKLHRFSRTIAEGDWSKLLQALYDGFAGTAQPIPGHCIAGKCVSIWYLEIGYQTVPDPDKASLYYGQETDPHPVPAYAGGETAAHPPASSPSPDQATQIVDGIRLAYCQPYVEAYFIFNLQLWDDADLGLWQSAVFWVDRTPKPSFPFAQQVIAEVNAHAVDCSALKGGRLPTAFHPLRGVDVASVSFKGHAVHVRLAEDATYTLILERGNAPVEERNGMLPLGWRRTLEFPDRNLRPGSYRLVLRLGATANPARRTTLTGGVFAVGG